MRPVHKPVIDDDPLQGEPADSDFAAGPRTGSGKPHKPPPRKLVRKPKISDNPLDGLVL